MSRSSKRTKILDSSSESSDEDPDYDPSSSSSESESSESSESCATTEKISSATHDSQHDNDADGDGDDSDIFRGVAMHVGMEAFRRIFQISRYGPDDESDADADADQHEGSKRRKKEDKTLMSDEQRNQVAVAEAQIADFRKTNIPPRSRILLSPMSVASKAKVLENMEALENMCPMASEYTKLKKWVDSVMTIPFGSCVPIPVSLGSSGDEISAYLQTIESKMNQYVFGQLQAKQSILECVGKWIANPTSQNRAIGFVGEKGTGKTTLAKYGIANALGRPFCMVSLGGESDASVFKGHDYTYEGARCGRIVDMLISSKCMNPVIFFDELDKISTTRSGDEIANMLIHLTDTTQNDRFNDRYFQGIDLDLSGCLFIFSYNDESRVNPILLDRMRQIEFKSFDRKDKLCMARDFIVPAVCRNLGLIPSSIELTNKTIETIIDRFAPKDGGVRQLEKIIETIFERVNLRRLGPNLNVCYKNIQLAGNKITPEMALSLLSEFREEQDHFSKQMMYL